MIHKQGLQRKLKQVNEILYSLPLESALQQQILVTLKEHGLNWTKLAMYWTFSGYPYEKAFAYMYARFNLMFYHAPQGIPQGFAILFLLDGLFPTPGLTESRLQAVSLSLENL